jgi:hypothetical protein
MYVMLWRWKLSTNTYDLFQVCGTPRSGKTTLAWLLHQYIQKKEPETKVIYFDNQPEGNPLRHWSDHLTASSWKWQDVSIIIFEEGQTIYCGSESRLWAFFKNILDDQVLYQNWVIVFACYSSPTGSISLIQTSIFILFVKRVTLYPVDHNDRTTAASLFLSPVEFNNLVSRWYPPNDYHFDSTFFSWIFQFTVGHVGGILDLISLITSKNVSHFFLSSRCKMMIWHSFWSPTTISKMENYTWTVWLDRMTC